VMILELLRKEAAKDVEVEAVEHWESGNRWEACVAHCNAGAAQWQACVGGHTCKRVLHCLLPAPFSPFFPLRSNCTSSPININKSAPAVTAVAAMSPQIQQMLPVYAGGKSSNCALSVGSAREMRSRLAVESSIGSFMSMATCTVVRAPSTVLTSLRAVPSNCC
jgi:hypothetical protein